MNCAQIESLNMFRCKGRRRANLTDDNNDYDSVPYQFLPHSEICEVVRQSCKTEEQLYHKTFLLSHELQRANSQNVITRKKFKKYALKATLAS